jgi:DNA invertase Pin-like site-specific DNA recombinase
MDAKEEKQAIIYNRSATRHISDDKLAEQKDELVAFAEQHGYKPVAVYSDVASGNTHPFKRQGFKKLVKHIEDSKPAAVIVSDYARIGRRMDCFLSVHLWLQVNGVELVAVYSPKGGVK